MLLLEAGRRARERLAEPKVKGSTHTHIYTHAYNMHTYAYAHKYSVSSQKHVIASR